MRKYISCLAFFAAVASLCAQTRHPVLMISVDGMKPDYVTHADEHHLRVPNLRRIMAEGAYAEGVQGVFPTVTYPSHTTLVTGVWPSAHGVLNNQRFDPEHKFNSAWYWYADQIKVPTLWDAAHVAGLRTASVGWPVTVDAKNIDRLIPEYWRGNLGDIANMDDRYLLNAVSRPPNEVQRIAQRTSTPYMVGNDTSLAGDEVKTVYSLDILKQQRPQFMTIHLSSLDEEQHLHGPFSEEANADLEALDGMIGRLVAQELSNFHDAAIVIVSDHGFAKVDKTVNFYVPFVDAGLIKVKAGPGSVVVTSWQAQPWILGCMAAVMLHDPNDSGTLEKARSIFDKLASDPANGIEAIIPRDQLARYGGISDAAFVVTLKPGYSSGAALSGPFVIDTPGRGTHGYNPSTSLEMLSSFFVTAPGIPRGKDLGQIDMRSIAPTVARILGVSLPAAQMPAVPLK